MAACGLDFGTSNTTLGLSHGGVPTLIALEGDEVTIPSAVFFTPGSEVRIGRAAIAAYVDGLPGRLLRGLKSVLGSSFVEEETQVGRLRLPFREVIARYVGAVKRRAEAEAGRELVSVVHGRPVHFVDGDPEGDRSAEATLRDIAHAIGFRDVSFQFEPIAAALDYERQIGSEQIALIADIGGGTSDFSIVRLGPERHRLDDRSGDILANGGVRIGGTDFDRQLSLGTIMPLLGYRSAMKRPGLDVPSNYFHELATWSSINRLYNRRIHRELQEVRRDAAQPQLIERLLRVVETERGHALAMEVEDAKISLSGEPETDIRLGWIEPDLDVRLERQELAAYTRELARRIAERIGLCMRQAALSADRIDALFLTGGSTQIPHVRAAVMAAAPRAKVVEGDTFGSVGKGLTLEAARRYGR
ncbi:MAG TPA: Hsp70 family protein [Beijerinckiaceae bacterium]|nr:Hsp70 family protein [Beijerinckiaceae bacterium]